VKTKNWSRNTISNRQLGNKRGFFSPTAIGKEIGESIGKIGEVIEANLIEKDTLFIS
jgi:hypothetical protein